MCLFDKNRNTQTSTCLRRCLLTMFFTTLHYGAFWNLPVLTFPVLSYEGKRRDSWGKEKVHNDEIVQHLLCGNNTAVISFSADVFTKSSEVWKSTSCLTNDQIYKRKSKAERERVDEERE